MSPLRGALGAMRSVLPANLLVTSTYLLYTAIYCIVSDSKCVLIILCTVEVLFLPGFQLQEALEKAEIDLVVKERCVFVGVCACVCVCACVVCMCVCACVRVHPYVP